MNVARQVRTVLDFFAQWVKSVLLIFKCFVLCKITYIALVYLIVFCNHFVHLLLICEVDQ